MTRRNPFEEIEEWIERMSEQVESADWSAIGSGRMAVDLVDAGDAYEIQADLPGYDRDDISLTLTDGTLSITAERDREAETAEDGRYVRRERRRDRVSRSVRIPEPVDEEEVSATYNNGVLSVHLPKQHAGDAGTQIDIE